MKSKSTVNTNTVIGTNQHGLERRLRRPPLHGVMLGFDYPQVHQNYRIATWKKNGYYDGRA